MIDEDTDIISETPEYSPKSEFSKAEIVKLGVQKCLEARGQEMMEGYFNTVLSKDGSPVKIWVRDTRKVFISCVDGLKGVLSPEISRDENFQKIYKKIKEDLDKLWKECAYQEETYAFEETPKGKQRVLRKTGRVYMPDIDRPLPALDPTTSKPSHKFWNVKINAYLDKKLEVYDRLFSALNDLIDRTNYFKATMGF